MMSGFLFIPVQAQDIYCDEDAVITNLTIDSGAEWGVSCFATVTVTGTIENYGRINVWGLGTLINKGIINNHDGGLIDVTSTLENQPGAVINNNAGGTISSLGVIVNKGTIENSGAPDNPATISLKLNSFQNSGTINNRDWGVITNEIEIKNLAGGVITNYEHGKIISDHNNKINNSGTIINHCGGYITPTYPEFNYKGNPIQGTGQIGLWDGEGDGANWSDPKNWACDLMPSGSDRIVLSKESVLGEVNLDIDFKLTSGTLTINLVNKLIIPLGKTLTSSGTIYNNGNIFNYGTLVTSNTLNNMKEFENTGLISNTGKIENSGTLSNYQQITNNGIFTNTGNLKTWRTFENQKSLENKGTIESAGTVINKKQITNSGTVHIAGILDNQAGGEITNEGTIEITSGTDKLIKIENFGTINNKGKLSVLANELINSKTIINSGTIENKNSGIITNTENAEIKNENTIINESKLKNSGKIVSSKDITNSRTFEILKSGTITLDQNGLLTNNDGAEMTNFGTLEIKSNGKLINNGKLITEKTIIDKDGLLENKKEVQHQNQHLANSGTVINSGKWYQGYNNDPICDTCPFFYNGLDGKMLNTPSGYYEIFRGWFNNEVAQPYPKLYKYSAILENQGKLSIKQFGGIYNREIIINSGTIDVERADLFENKEGVIDNSGTIILREAYFSLLNYNTYAEGNILSVIYNEGLIDIKKESAMSHHYRLYNKPGGVLSVDGKLGFSEKTIGVYDDLLFKTDIINDGCILLNNGARLESPEDATIRTSGLNENTKDRTVLAESIPKTNYKQSTSENILRYDIIQSTKIGGCSNTSPPPLMQGNPPPKYQSKNYDREIVTKEDFVGTSADLTLNPQFDSTQIKTESGIPETTPSTTETKASVPPTRISESEHGHMIINERKFDPAKIEETEVKLQGEIKDYEYGTVVMLEIEKPDGTIVEKGFAARQDGTFDTKIVLDETWDSGRYVVKTKYNENQIGVFSIEIDMQKVPTWIKNNAKWWSENQIDDNTFVQGIQFLIKEKIMRISGQPSSQDGTSGKIPDWIKNNAGWWVDGMISESDFVSGIKYLIENGIVKVP